MSSQGSTNSDSDSSTMSEETGDTPMSLLSYSNKQASRVSRLFKTVRLKTSKEV